MSVWSIITLLLACGFCAGAAGRRSMEFERNIMLALRNPTNPSVPIGPYWLQEAVRDVTSLGSTVVLGTMEFAVSSYFFLSDKSTTAWFLLVTVFSGLAINNLLKLGYARERPSSVSRHTQLWTTSLPSGHTAMSTIAYLTLSIIFSRLFPNFYVYFITFAILLVLCVGLSRIYLGIHYPTDVVTGWCLGAAWSLISLQVASRLHIPV